jgi:hypothetical protein
MPAFCSGLPDQKPPKTPVITEKKLEETGLSVESGAFHKTK